MKKLLCFFGLHDWLVYKEILVKEFDESFWRITTYKCISCGKKKDKIEEIIRAAIRTLQASAAQRNIIRSRQHQKPRSPNPYMEGF
jgi:hypothetical protein